MSHHHGRSQGKLLVIALAVVALAAWFMFRQRPASAPASSAGKKLTVTASFYPLAYFSTRIGGDKADVVNITPAGAEPHDYGPSALDAARMETSDILILNGGGLEPWGDDIRKNIDPARTFVMTAGEGLTVGQVEERGTMTTDPHVWLSPRLAERMVDRIESAFAQVDPADAARFRANAVSLKSDLDALDRDYAAGLANCADKKIVTSHAAFSYLASAYGLTQVSIAGLSPDAEPSPKQLADIAGFVRNNGVKYVFFESLVSPKLSDTIAEEVGAKTLVLNPIEGLTQADLAAGKDYLSEMRENLANLRIALRCED